MQRNRRAPRSGLRPGERRTAVAALAVAGVAVLAVALSPVLGVVDDASELTVDPAAYWQFSRRSGALSHAGVALWFFAAGAALFAASRLAETAGRRRFLLVLGVVSAALGVDDVLQVHEAVGEVVGAGLADEVVQALYALAFLAFLVHRRAIVAETPWVLLAGAGGCFAVSLALDAAPGDPHVVEDGAKFVGIALWAAYLWLAAGRFAGGVPAPDRR
jgi:hypothetical protein